jgi:hypothetical protein
VLEQVEETPVLSPSKTSDAIESMDDDFGDPGPEYFAVQAAKLKLEQVQATSPIVNNSTFSVSHSPIVNLLIQQRRKKRSLLQRVCCTLTIFTSSLFLISSSLCENFPLSTSQLWTFCGYQTVTVKPSDAAETPEEGQVRSAMPV